LARALMTAPKKSRVGDDQPILQKESIACFKQSFDFLQRALELRKVSPRFISKQTFSIQNPQPFFLLRTNIVSLLLKIPWLKKGDLSAS
jgi:hypothetical protein